MTLGTGIFLSTILLVTIYLLGKVRLKAALKWVGAALGAIVVLIFAAIVYEQWNNRPTVVTEIDKIALGMEEADLLIRKGRPVETEPGSKAGDKYLYFDKPAYSEGAKHYALIRDGKVFMVAANCTGFVSVNGISCNESEEFVVSKLGKPDAEKKFPDRFMKLIAYKKYNMLLEISRGEVSQLVLLENPDVSVMVAKGTK